jgi:hypothetical protein
MNEWLQKQLNGATAALANGAIPSSADTYNSDADPGDEL